MGRELQKRKNRSSVSKVTQKPKSKKKLLHNPIVASHWDQKATLSQNYKRLGLASKLNHATGGTEKSAAILEAEELKKARNGAGAGHDSFDIQSKVPTKIDISEVRIERDPETGAIISVLDDETSRRSKNPLNDPLNDLEDSEDEEGWQGFVNEHGILPGANGKGRGNWEEQTEVVRRLEEEAARPRQKKIRKQSDREMEWVQALVETHADDFKAMTRDMKLNPMQQSEGDIKRRVRKWKEAQDADA